MFGSNIVFRNDSPNDEQNVYILVLYTIGLRVQTNQRNNYNTVRVFEITWSYYIAKQYNKCPLVIHEMKP